MASETSEIIRNGERAASESSGRSRRPADSEALRFGCITPSAWPPEESSCSACAHVTRYGNCGEPVAAGLVGHFGLVRHPDNGRGCAAFTAREPAGGPRAYAHFSIRERLAHLLELGAIDDADAQLVRERFDVHSADEWLTLLDWCEAAVLDAATAGEAAPPCGDRPAAGRHVAADAEKRAGGPISPASRLSAEVPSARDLDSAPSAGTPIHPTHVPTQQPGVERSLFD